MSVSETSHYPPSGWGYGWGVQTTEDPTEDVPATEVLKWGRTLQALSEAKSAQSLVTAAANPYVSVVGSILEVRWSLDAKQRVRLGAVLLRWATGVD